MKEWKKVCAPEPPASIVHCNIMADAEPRFPDRKASAALPLPEQTVLVLQGGGALGSYQAGVFEALAEARVEPTWLAGISIGAINAAIIAGNPLGQRKLKLRSFWERLTSGLPSFPVWPNELMREALHEWSAGYVAMVGVPGFFAPRLIAPQFEVPGTEGALSFYDSAPLEETLNGHIDWDILNDGEVRLSVGAVNIENGNFRYFDTEKERLDARHIMASGALPPGFAPVEIDGALWWDGGLVSNTPLQYVVGERTGDMLVFQVDLFVASDTKPQTIDDVWAREKEIRYSSRTRQVTDQLLKHCATSDAIRKVLDKLPKEMCDDPAVKALIPLAEEPAINIVHLIYKANAWEGGARDYEFSRRTMIEHWKAGRDAVAETMDKGEVIASNIVNGESAAFDLNSSL